MENDICPVCDKKILLVVPNCFGYSPPDGWYVKVSCTGTGIGTGKKLFIHEFERCR